MIGHLAAEATAAPKSTLEIIVPVLGALVALFGTLLVLWQRWRSDNRVLAQKTRSDREALDQKIMADKRQAWWDRTQWAMERALSTTDMSTGAVCMAVLKRAGLSDLATQRDGEMLVEVAAHLQSKWSKP